MQSLAIVSAKPYMPPLMAETIETPVVLEGLSEAAFLMFFFAAFAFLAALAFGLYARRYRVVDHYRPA